MSTSNITPSPEFLHARDYHVRTLIAALLVTVTGFAVRFIVPVAYTATVDGFVTLLLVLSALLIIADLVILTRPRFRRSIGAHNAGIILVALATLIEIGIIAAHLASSVF